MKKKKKTLNGNEIRQLVKKCISSGSQINIYTNSIKTKTEVKRKKSHTISGATNEIYINESNETLTFATVNRLHCDFDLLILFFFFYLDGTQIRKECSLFSL